jgi:TolB protein
MSWFHGRMSPQPAAVLFSLLVVGCLNGSRSELPPVTSTGPVAPSTTASMNPEGAIVYSTETDAGDDVFLLDLELGTSIRLTNDPEKEFDPALSPDGRFIAYRRNTRPDSDEADIWLMSVDGSQKRNITNSSETSDWAPGWTPDGRIVFTSDREGTLELWTMSQDGDDLNRVSQGWCEYGQSSPDGSAYVCAASVSGQYDLVIVTPEGERRPLTSTPETEFGASWSPDGEWIAFSRDVSERWELYRIRPDGSDEALVASEGVFPTWSPQGHLAWTGPGGINVLLPDGSVVVLEFPAQFMSWGVMEPS